MSKRIKRYITKEECNANSIHYKNVLPESRFKILQLRFEQEKSVRTIANEFKVSTTRIYQLIAHAFHLLENAGFATQKE